jgi:hypothetical protein
MSNLYLLYCAHSWTLCNLACPGRKFPYLWCAHVHWCPTCKYYLINTGEDSQKTEQLTLGRYGVVVLAFQMKLGELKTCNENGRKFDMAWEGQLQTTVISDLLVNTFTSLYSITLFRTMTLRYPAFSWHFTLSKRPFTHSIPLFLTPISKWLHYPTGHKG